MQIRCSCRHVKMLNIALSPRVVNVQGVGEKSFWVEISCLLTTVTTVNTVANVTTVTTYTSVGR